MAYALPKSDTSNKFLGIKLSTARDEKRSSFAAAGRDCVSSEQNAAGDKKIYIAICIRHISRASHQHLTTTQRDKKGATTQEGGELG